MIPTTFQVIKSLNHDIILGMTFLTNTQANIDLAKGEITLYDGLVGANLGKNGLRGYTPFGKIIPKIANLAILGAVSPHFM